jgi:SAM-dependent methyltransferase
MSMGQRKALLKLVNRLLAPLGASVVGRWVMFSNYIPLAQTEREARRAGMSIGDYIDTKNNYPGATKETIDRVATFGVFERPVSRICEIGPGSGRYLEKVKERCPGALYEIYETADDWKRRLVRQYGVTARETDGRTLAQTPDGAVDIIHAHRVFEGLPVMTCLQYFEEAGRVMRPGGWFFFDVLTEECLTPELTRSWIDSGWNWIVSMFPKRFLVERMKQLGLDCRGSFILPMRPGVGEYMIFQKPESPHLKVPM